MFAFALLAVFACFRAAAVLALPADTLVLPEFSDAFRALSLDDNQAFNSSTIGYVKAFLPRPPTFSPPTDYVLTKYFQQRQLSLRSSA